ncbi:MAG TPA: enoyl-CoA hydratase [Terriglobales bacterium]|nr:enoyl-CoA hydratase [Terriglobales bacterium]
MSYEEILVAREGRVGMITLNRPAAMNALSSALMREVGEALDAFEADAGIGAMVLTGNEKAFAAGADIKEMQDAGFSDIFLADFPAGRAAAWRRITTIRKPIIAAVAGYALGGGCELAMACDFILAADTAVFGQPEITIGTMPGAGGTQRLARALGKSKAMEMCLTGRRMDAAEAERSGLVARVVPAAELLAEAVRTAAKIAAMSLPATMMVKEAVNTAFETPLAEGLRFERRAFQSTFATEDRREGMAAFAEKRKPNFKHR